MENSSDDSMLYEYNLKFLTSEKERYSAKLERLSLTDTMTDATIATLIDTVLYLSERVKILEQEKEHFYG